MNTFDEVREVVGIARKNIEAADIAVRGGARLAKHRLRLADVDSDTLTALKQELRDWNINTRKWKPRT